MSNDENQRNEALRPVASYVPWQTFCGLLDRLKATAIPTRLDSSMLRHMSGTAQSQLNSALKFLGLIDGDGSVTETFRELVRAYKTPQWKDHLASLILRNYEPIVGQLDIKTATPGQLREAFQQRGGVDGATSQKAVRFYLMALKSAEVAFSPHLRVRQRASRRSTVRRGITPKTLLDRDIERPSVPHGTFRVSFEVLGFPHASAIIPEEISDDQWAAMSNYVKTVLSLRRQALSKPGSGASS
jgi:hypothetical protein